MSNGRKPGNLPAQGGDNMSIERALVIVILAVLAVFVIVTLL
ncbi:hypothetical protein SEA_EVY_142 [Streptomyces phage Evy]|uniref:Uncharacterized protein n=1 Tax=Streptomyces phage Evy TaxID=2588514 RepID=A0A514DK63_9CAUD|nr:hypothetical protein KNU67_gp138 [Streptomyces phage Evy]QDH93994.1 hypothetical protein SEA_EVY_142 [Streptomyces phage Evy]UEM46916.1 hypothetical protein SEA_TARGARYEN_146 [Streptomyces phage Targaryen]